MSWFAVLFGESGELVFKLHWPPRLATRLTAEADRIGAEGFKLVAHMTREVGSCVYHVLIARYLGVVKLVSL